METNMAAKTYQDLIAWQRAMNMVEGIYRATRNFPRDEMYGLTSQIRRAAVSIPSNIAEGQGRGVGNDFGRFLRVAQGSLQEMETQLLLALRLQYLSKEDASPLLALTDEGGRLLRGLCHSITRQLATSN
jgi:four helix bundle protein